MFIKVSGLILLVVIASIPLFIHLDVLPFRLWDESRLASNAYEMHRNGNLIVTYYEGQPEMWNTKPPLAIWMQLFFIKILGFNELAVRLPSAIAGLLTCVTLLFFSHKFFKTYLIGAFASLVLVTTNGYVDTHAIRTGDYDGPLSLFTTIFILSSFVYAERENKKWLTPLFAGIALAVLTKSVQPLLFVPGIVIYFLFRKKTKLLFSKPFITGCITACVIAGAYYIVREVVNEGYLLAVWNNELGGRYFNGLEENDAGPMYYVSRMGGYLFTYWIWLLPVAIIGGLVSKDEKIRHFTIFNFIVATTYFIFITISKTKLYWYTVPLFPLLSLHIATLLYQVYVLLKRIHFLHRYPLFAVIIIGVIFIYPYQKIGRKVYHPTEYTWDNMYPVSELLQDAFHHKMSMKNKVIAYTDYDQHFKVYTDALHDRGEMITYKQPENLSPGDTVIASEAQVYKVIEEKYNYEIIKNENGVKEYAIKSARK
jgi:4-amino-4-deoxy-L-arabinose transferase-like glycosyltransferase